MSQRIAALIRHGAYHQRPGVPSALQPFPLTQEGQVQARTCGRNLAALLTERRWALDPFLHSSCQLRAWQTGCLAKAELAAAGHACKRIEQSPALAERGLGSAANLSLEEIEAVMATDPRFDTPPEGWKSNSDYCLPLQGAESLMMAGERVASHIRTTLRGQPSPDQPTLTLFFGHGASFRHAAHHLGILSRNDIARLSMFHARALLVCYNDDGTWSHCGGDWKQRTAKDTPLD